MEVEWQKPWYFDGRFPIAVLDWRVKGLPLHPLDLGCWELILREFSECQRVVFFDGFTLW